VDLEITATICHVPTACVSAAGLLFSIPPHRLFGVAELLFVNSGLSLPL